MHKTAYLKQERRSVKTAIAVSLVHYLMQNAVSVCVQSAAPSCRTVHAPKKDVRSVRQTSAYVMYICRCMHAKCESVCRSDLQHWPC